MTMIIALHLGAYVIVAADKRETYQVNGEVVSILSDDVQKLIEWHGGVELVVATFRCSQTLRLD